MTVSVPIGTTGYKTVYWRLHGDASSVISGEFQIATCRVSVPQGGLDTTFNPPDGYVLYNGWNKDSYIGSAIQADGKIVVSSGIEDGADDDVVVLRYNDNGTLDETFGMNGVATYDGGKGDDCGRLVAIQPDGRIVLTGYTYNGTSYDILTMRYNTNGTPDSSFGTNGVVTYDSGNKDDYGRAIAVQTDGKIVVTARSSYATTSDATTSVAMILRYNGDGTLDNTFGSNGVVTYEGGYGNDGFRGVVIQTDGKIVVSGYTGINIGFDVLTFDVLTARYNSDGSLDTTFGTGGVAIHDGGHGDDGARGVVIQTDGKIVVSGGQYNGTDLDVLVLRYDVNGTPDDTFGAKGVVTYDSGNGNDYGRRLAIRRGSNIVVTGRRPNGTDYDVLVLRYNAHGGLDNSFGGSGVVTFDMGKGNDYGEGVVIQADAKIVILGGSYNGTNYDVLVFRLLAFLAGGGSSGGCFIATAGYGF